VEQISAPTLVLGSDQDLILNETSVAALAKKIPRAQFYCFSQCGHVPQVEYPNLFTEIVIQFIKSVPIQL
jgi:3-oxoadipate enol-lactonase